MNTASSPPRMTVKKVKVMVAGMALELQPILLRKEKEGRRSLHQTTFSPCCCCCGGGGGGGGCWLCCWSEEEFGVADEELFEESKLLFPLLLSLPPPAKERGKDGPLESVFLPLGVLSAATHLLQPRCPGNLDRPD